MKLDGWLLRISVFATAAFFNATTPANSQQFPLLSLSNTIPTNSPPVANSEPASNSNAAVAVIEIRDVPISAAIENLARQAGINYLFDARLIEWWLMPNSDDHTTHELILNFRWENLSAKQALIQLLQEHNLVLLEDPLTSVARITYTNQVINPAEASFLGSETNSGDGNGPVIRMQNVPISIVLENLARQAGINYALDPKIGYGLPDTNGRIEDEPSLTFYWHNVTTKQGLVAVCANYNLDIVKIPATSIYLIRAKDHPITNFVDASLLGSNTNIVPAIRVQNVPVTSALETLERQAGVNYEIDPKVGHGRLGENRQIEVEPSISFRWENVTAKEAIVALCENYDLVIVKDFTTDVIRIKPKD